MQRLLAPVAGLILLAAPAVQAQEEAADRRFYFSPQGSYLIGDSDRALDDAAGYSLSLGKILGRGSNLEFSADFVEPDAENGERGPSLESYGIGLLMFPMRKELPWYIVARIAKGQTIYEDDAGNEEEIDSDQFDLGLGYLWSLGAWPWVGDSPALRLEARYRFDKYANSEAEQYAAAAGIDEERSFHDYLIGIGLHLPLGPDPKRTRVPLEEREPDQVIVVPYPDADGDQIPDDMDDCPDTPPGSRINARGCAPDSDGDGVADTQDACPGTAVGATVDARGCPPDGDRDGISDAKDQCPTSPRGARVLSDGCAPREDCRLPQPGQAVDARGCAAGQALVLQGVNFATASDELTAAGKQRLDDVAPALSGNPSVRYEIGGHTDSVGGAAANQALSEARALAVKRYLVAQGVDANVLVARGYGESQPRAENDSALGRARNRRVELKVIAND